MGSRPQEKVKERGHRSHEGLEKLWHYKQLERDGERRARKDTITQWGLAGRGKSPGWTFGGRSAIGTRQVCGAQIYI